MTQVLVREEVTEAPSATLDVHDLPPPGWYGTVEDLWLRYWSGTDWVDPTTRAGPPPGPEARTRNVLGLPEAMEQRAEAVRAASQVCRHDEGGAADGGGGDGWCPRDHARDHRHYLS